MILNSGLEIPVRIIQINSYEVVYQKCSDVLNRKFRKNKKFISTIKFADGHEVKFNEYKETQEESEKRKKGTKAAAGLGVGFVLLTPLGIFGLIALFFAFLEALFG